MEFIYRNLLFKKLSESSSECYRQLRNNPEIKRYFFSKETISVEMQEIWYRGYLERDDDIMFSAHIIENETIFVGAAAIYNISTKDRVAEFGRIAVDPIYRGRGYGLTITEGVCRYAFDTLGLQKIYLDVYEDNHYAINTYYRAGFWRDDATAMEGMELSDKKIIRMAKLKDMKELGQ